MSPRHRATAVITDGLKILLIHRLNHGSEYWTVPGGGIEEGESPEVAVVREAEEETGLRVKKITPAFIYEESHSSGQRTNYVFQCQIEPGEMRVGGPEIDRSSEENVYEPIWIEIDKIADLSLRPVDIKSHLLNYLNASGNQKS